MKSAIELSNFIYYSVETITVFIKETGMDLECFYKVSHSVIKAHLHSQSSVPDFFHHCPQTKFMIPAVHMPKPTHVRPSPRMG